MLTFKDVLRTSRPLLWLNTSVLWVLALLVLQQPPTWVDIVMILYFTLPFNLWLHGINDVYDYASDLLNERKGSDEGALLRQVVHAPMLKVTLLWNIPFWVLALLFGTPLSTVLLATFVFLGWAYSAPPIRGKSRPFVDSLINVAYILPYLIGLAWHSAPAQLWQASLPAIVAFAGWSIASHAFTSIQDIEADQAGSISTVATFLGARNTAWFALVGYGIAALAAAFYGIVWGILLVVYWGYVLFYLRRPVRAIANRLYRWFIVTNSALGFIVTVFLAVSSPPNTLWAAIVVLSLVALVIGALAWGKYELRPTPAHSEIS